MTPTVRSLIGVLVLAATAAAQNAPVPTISSIPSRQAFDPGRLVVFGSNMGLVTGVRLDGEPVPIIRITPTRLVAGPLEPRAPGFDTVELIYPRGRTVGTLELTPSLSASRRGRRVTTVLNNGDVGSYVVSYSYTRLAMPESDPGIYYARWLPLGSPVLTAGVFDESHTATMLTQLPVQSGLIGAPLNLQALCTVGIDGFESYTNLTSFLGFGQFH